MNSAPWTVYVVHEAGAAASGPVKIGTATNLTYRLSGLQNGNWRRLVVAKQWIVASRDVALRTERRVLQNLKDVRLGSRDWLMCGADEVCRAVNEVLAAGPQRN